MNSVYFSPQPFQTQRACQNRFDRVTMLKKPGVPTLRCGPVTTGAGIPITLIFGFLGSGKTTLLRRWKLDPATQSSAFIVSELQEFGIDTALLRDKQPKPQSNHIVDCIGDLDSKASEMALNTALKDVASCTPLPAHAFVESAGTARPWSVIEPLSARQEFHIRHLVVTVDALNLHRDFSDGRVFTGEANLSEDAALHHAAEIIAEQLFFASVLILTKTDTVSTAAVDTQIRVLRTLQPDVVIGLSGKDGFSLSNLDVAPVPNLEELSARAAQFGLHGECSEQTKPLSVSLHDPRPFHPQRLYDLFRRHLGTSIYRTKGFLWLASRPDDVLLLQQAGSHISLERMDSWTTMTFDQPREYSPIQGEQIDATEHKDHPIYGNRKNALTFCALPSACRIFETALCEALCTDEEVTAWQNGTIFIDPWPRADRDLH